MRMIEAEVLSLIVHSPGPYSPEVGLENVGRTCYKSEDKITEDLADKFVRMLRDRGHHAMLEHCLISAVVRVDRGVTHEWVRHRLASYAQESTRYCNYGKGKFGSEITVVEYPWKNPESHEIHKRAAEAAERFYMELLDAGEPPELARAVLPISVKTDLVISANAREWMHIFKMRTDSHAHPMIRSITKQIAQTLSKQHPALFAAVEQE